MKEFKEVAAQGDVRFERYGDELPAKISKKMKPVKAEDGVIIVTHSETGHHHVMEASAAQLFRDPDDPLISWLKVERPTALEHRREHHTHESIQFEPGVYRVRRQREHDPLRGVARRAID